MKRYFPAYTFLFLITSIGLVATAQDTATKRMNQPKVWISTANEAEINGILVGAQDSALLIYVGTREEFKSQSSPTLTRIQCNNILVIKAQKKNAILQGVGLGALTGFGSILVFGPEGAVVGIVLCTVAGAIYGVLKKEKFRINGDIKKFNQFIKEFRQK